jgi:hypothetical protein
MDIPANLTPEDRARLANNFMLADLSRAGGVGLLAMLGLGAGWRGLSGLRDALVPPQRFVPPPRILPIHVPAEDEEKRAQSQIRPNWTVPHGAEFVQSHKDPATGKWNDPNFGFGQGRVGQKPDDVPKSPYDVPWAWLLPLAGAGTAYGGYKLVDWLLDKSRRSEMDAELEAAKQKYEEALATQYTAGRKHAADGSLAADLDKLYDKFEKQAGIGKFIADTADFVTGGHGGALTGGYGLYATGTGLLAALATYKAMQKQQKRKTLEEAYKVMQRRQWAARPPELVAEVTSPAEAA